MMQFLPETRVSLILRLAKPTDVQAWQEFSDVYVARCRVLKLLREEVQDLDSTLSGEWEPVQENVKDPAEPLLNSHESSYDNRSKL